MLSDKRKEEIVLGALGEEQPIKWIIKLEEDYDDGDYLRHEWIFDNDGFLKEGLPIALIIHSIIGDCISDHEALEELIEDYILYSDQVIAHTITEIKVKYGNRELDLNAITDEDAREIVLEYLNKQDYWLTRDEIEEIMSDLYGSMQI